MLKIKQKLIFIISIIFLFPHQTFAEISPLTESSFIEAQATETMQIENESDWYQIEMIAFTQKDSTNSMPSQEAHLDIKNTIELANFSWDICASNIVPISTEDFHLDSVLKKLNKASEYKVVYYGGWQQPIFDSEGKAYKLLIHSDEDLAKRILPTYIDNNKESNFPHLWKLAGVLTLKQTRYLHANLHFIWRNYKSEHVENFEIQSKQKLKLNKLYYFDHPRFGVLMQVAKLSQIPDMSEYCVTNNNPTKVDSNHQESWQYESPNNHDVPVYSLEDF